MEVRIGIQHSARELSFESNAKPEELRQAIEKAVAGSELLSLTDTKGAQYLIAGGTISYVEIGAEAGRKVGFVS